MPTYDPPSKLMALTTVGIETVNSRSFQADRFSTIGFQINVSDAAGITGTTKVQVTIDGVNWGDYAGSSLAIAGNTVLCYSIAEFAFVAVRVVIDVTVGSGDFEIFTLAKQS